MNISNVTIKLSTHEKNHLISVTPEQILPKSSKNNPIEEGHTYFPAG